MLIWHCRRLDHLCTTPSMALDKYGKGTPRKDRQLELLDLVGGSCINYGSNCISFIDSCVFNDDTPFVDKMDRKAREVESSLGERSNCIENGRFNN